MKKDKKKKRGSPSPKDVVPKQSETVVLFPSDPDLRIPAEAVKDRQKMREFQSSMHKQFAINSPSTKKTTKQFVVGFNE